MTKTKVTATAFIIFISILLWDIYLYSDDIEGNSITQIIISLSSSYPLVPASIGFLMGFLFAHFFDTTSQPKKDNDDNKEHA